MHPNEISGAVVDVALQVHKQLGPGLLESVYVAVLSHELRKRGMHVEVQVPIPVVWDDLKLEIGFRADLIVENTVVVELKSVEEIAPVHRKQLLTYLKLTRLPIGLLINFNAELLKDGITRIVNNLPENPPRS